MKLVTFLGSFNPVVGLLVHLAEVLFAGPKQGESKYAFVEGLIVSAAQGIPGLKADVEEVKAGAEQIIEGAVKALHEAQAFFAGLENEVDKPTG